MAVIHTALSGALAAQAALNTASQNIANVMTPGYTRQGVQLAAVQLSGAGQSPGSGVRVPSLIRFNDSYKSLQMWQAASGLGQFSAGDIYFQQLEQVMGNDASSINSGIDAFFAALNAASVEPTSSPLRQQVVTAADALAQRFNSLRQVLSNQRTAIGQQRASVVDQVNILSADIAGLNQKIAAMRSADSNSSGLMDERDRKIDELAGLVAVQVMEQPDGARTVSLRSGPPLVVGTAASKVKIQGNADGSTTLTLTFASESFTLSGDNLGGQLGGLGAFESKILVPLTQSIIDMAGELAAKFNTQLTAGFAMDGSPGTALFAFDSASVAGMLKVNAGLTGDQLGFSSSASEPGDSGNLLALIDLKNQPVAVSSLGNVLLGDAYTQLLGKLGMDSQQNAAALSTAKTVRTQTEESWKSTSGVNSDEEAVNLMQYQQMYQANMKVIAVANQLFDATLAMF